MTTLAQIPDSSLEQDGIISESPESDIAWAAKYSAYPSGSVAMVDGQSFSGTADFTSIAKRANVFDSQSISSRLGSCLSAGLAERGYSVQRFLSSVKLVKCLECLTYCAVMTNLRAVVADAAFSTYFANMEVGCATPGAGARLSLCSADTFLAACDRVTASALGVKLIEWLALSAGLAHFFHNAKNNMTNTFHLASGD